MSRSTSEMVVGFFLWWLGKSYDCIDVMMSVSTSQTVVGFSLVVRKTLRLYKCDDEGVYQSNGCRFFFGG